MRIDTALRGTMGISAALLLAGGTAWAGGAPASDLPGDQGMVSAAGRVQKIDRAGGTMEIEGIDRELKVDPDTDVTRNGSPASFSDLQEGEQVRASFEDGFPAHVREVEIMSPTGETPDTTLPRRDRPSTSLEGSAGSR